MNLNLINLDPKDWSREDWQDAYTQYCQSNMFGPKTKKEYYDMVLERVRFTQLNCATVPDDMKAKWSAGRRAAQLWARTHKCNMNGRLLADIIPPREDVDDLANRLDNVEKNHDNLKKAYCAHVTKINRNLPNMK